jgi:hypothetical protein
LVQLAKILMVSFLLIAFVGIGISAGGLGLLTTANVEITYPTTKDNNSFFTKTEMIDFDGVTYEVKGNTIILNKKGLFNNREIPLIQEQNCLEYKESCKEYEKICIKQNYKEEIAFCEKYEETKYCLFPLEKICIKWTAFTKTDFIKMAIQKELEFIKSVQNQRANKTITQVDTNGKVSIK